MQVTLVARPDAGKQLSKEGFRMMPVAMAASGAFLWLGGAVVNILFAVAIHRDALELGARARLPLLVDRGVWVLATLLGGVVVRDSIG